MPKWTARLELTNNTEQVLQLIETETKIHRNSKISLFPNEIQPGRTGIFEVYTPSGVPAGPEFAIKLRAQANRKSPSRGTLNYHIDVPISNNSTRYAECHTNGSLHATGLKKLDHKPSGWLWQSKLEVEDQLAPENAQAGVPQRLNWDSIASLPVQKDVPEIQILKREATNNDLKKMVYRSEPKVIPQKKWQQIEDPKVTTDYQNNLISDYFIVRAWSINSIEQVTLPKDLNKSKKITITHSSQIRNQIEKELTIGSSVGVDIKGLSAEVKTEYSIRNLNEYINSNSKTTEETVNYSEKPYDRQLVYYDIAQAVLIYRRDMKNNTSLVAVGDYYHNTFSKTFDLVDA